MTSQKPGRKTRFFANLAESCLKCDQCDARFWIQSKLDKHRATHVQTNLTCKICDQTFTNCEDLNQHYLLHKPQFPKQLKNTDTVHSDFRRSEKDKTGLPKHCDSAKTIGTEVGQRSKSVVQMSGKDQQQLVSAVRMISKGGQHLESAAQLMVKGEQRSKNAAQMTAKSGPLPTAITVENPTRPKRKSILKSVANAGERKVSLLWKEPLVSPDLKATCKVPSASEVQIPSVSLGKRKKKLPESVEKKLQTEDSKKLPIRDSPVSRTSECVRLQPAISCQLASPQKKIALNKTLNSPQKTVLQVDDVSFRNLIFDKLQQKTNVSQTFPNISVNRAIPISVLSSRSPEPKKEKKPDVTLIMLPSAAKNLMTTTCNENDLGKVPLSS